MLISPAKRQIRDWIVDSTAWDAYEPRLDDIIIGTSAKCGTTWMQQIVSLLVFQSPTPREIDQVSPWLDMRIIPLEDKLDRLAAQEHRRFIKTHLPLNAVPLYDEVRYIHVAREGRDACLSWQHHSLIMKPGIYARFDEAGMSDPELGRPYPRPLRDFREFFLRWMKEDDGPLRNDGWPAARYFAIERSYWRERRLPNVLLVHYNDLKTDLAGEMRRVADFLEIEIGEDLWPELVNAATFEAMKQNAARLGPGREMAFDGGMSAFLNKGANARWRDVLTPDDIAMYDARARFETTPGLARWLESGRLVAGDPRQTSD